MDEAVQEFPAKRVTSHVALLMQRESVVWALVRPKIAIVPTMPTVLQGEVVATPSIVEGLEPKSIAWLLVAKVVGEEVAKYRLPFIFRTFQPKEDREPSERRSCAVVEVDSCKSPCGLVVPMPTRPDGPKVTEGTNVSV